jgi:hypothetical protein
LVYRPGYGWVAAAAIGAGAGYWGGYDDYYVDPYAVPATDPAVAACAQRYRSYDPVSRTYLAKGGKRVACP